MRLFIAVQLPEPILAALTRVQQEIALRIGEATARMIAAANLHITLHFLGNEPKNRVSDVVDAVVHGVESAPTMRLRFVGTGCFPSLRRPRVLWVGVRDEEAQLATLHSSLAGELSGRGFAVEDRPYRPHVTIGYVRKRAKADGVRSLAAVVREYRNTSFDTATVSRVALMSSVTKPGGSVYSELFGAELV